MTQDSTDRTFQKCLHKIVDLLSRRDYSAQELHQKLTQKHFNPATAQKAIEWAQERRYLRPPEELSQSLAQQLLERGKGRHYIQQYLKKRGLPSIEEFDKETELRKALEFAQRKLSRNSSASLDRAAREKVGQQLVRRGFSIDIVRTVIYDKLKANDSYND